VDSLSTDFAPDKFSDEYQEQLRKLIAAKIEQGDALDTAATFGEEAEARPQADVVDLMEALRQSVERSRASRGGERSRETGPTPVSKRSPAKKSAAKKAPAKKSAASRSTAKKGPAKKAAKSARKAS
jgi:DNA end-binding protein Ku